MTQVGSLRREMASLVSDKEGLTQQLDVAMAVGRQCDAAGGWASMNQPAPRRARSVIH